MSGAELFRKLDDFGAFPAIPLPLDNSGSTFGASDEEHIDRHGEGKLADGDLHISVDNFVFGDCPHPQWQGGHTLTQPLVFSDSADPFTTPAITCVNRSFVEKNPTFSDTHAFAPCLARVEPAEERPHRRLALFPNPPSIMVGC